ncbi:MAG: glycosyltransferase family 2 protein, partial [Candidatus Binatia bacterium]
MNDSFRVIAIVAAFNEEDIISSVIGHLAHNGIDAYLIDNHSTDDTVKEASQWLGHGLVRIERFPQTFSPGQDAPGPFDWSAILRRKEELATELAADWFIHHDADEFRESPWPGLTLKEAIRWVDKLGYNCINFQVLNFCPVDDNFQPGDDPRNHFTLFEHAAAFDKVQLKCWMVSETQDSLVTSGGHEVCFEGRRVFPISFLNRHYPIRGQRHGLKKVFAERKNRFLESERLKGWHIQYDPIKDENHNFLRDPATLQAFNLDRARFELMLPEKLLQDLADRLVRTEEELDTFRSTKKDQEQVLLAKQHELAQLAVERGQFAQQADQLQQTIRRQEDALADTDQRVIRITEDRDRLVQELTELEAALQLQREKVEDGQVQLEQLSLDHERLGQDVLNLQATVQDQRQELAKREHQIIDLITQQDHSNHRLLSMGIRCQETEGELTELKSEHRHLRKNVAMLQGTVQQQSIALETLYGTLGWLLTTRLRPVKDKLLSPGSRL